MKVKQTAYEEYFECGKAGRRFGGWKSWGGGAAFPGSCNTGSCHGVSASAGCARTGETSAAAMASGKTSPPHHLLAAAILLARCNI